jgi:hypothetical protein
MSDSVLALAPPLAAPSENGSVATAEPAATVPAPLASAPTVRADAPPSRSTEPAPAKVAPPPRPAPAPSQAAASRCNPPYRFDATGKKVWKVECFK